MLFRSLLILLRQRALERQALEQAMTWLAEANWGKFLRKMYASPTQNRRGNLRQMITERPDDDWAALFTAMLDKSPGRQWKVARSWSPFTNRLEHLSEVMPEALRRKRFLEVFPALSPKLLGPEPSSSELEIYQSRAHRIFLLELLSAWEKMARTATSDNGENAHAHA